jgi:hypothetical protein
MKPKITKLSCLLITGTLTTILTSQAAVVLRLDASEFDTAGGAIGTWSDSSGKGNDVTQAGGGFQPEVVLNAQNGLSVVRLDGVDDYMDSSTTSYTVGSVFSVASYAFASFPGGGSGYKGLYGGDNSSDGIYLTGATNSTNWYTSELDSQYLNGGSSTTALTAANAFNLYSGTDSTPATLNGHSIGHDRGDPNRSWAGDIAEIIVYDEALSEFDRQGVEVYLDEKWGLGQNLATTYGTGNYNTDLVGLSLVPEPGTYALLAGLTGLVFVMVRRRR